MKLKLLASVFLLANIAHAADGLRPDEMGDLNIPQDEYDVLFGTPINQDMEQIERMEDLMASELQENSTIVTLEPVPAKPSVLPKETPPVPREDVAWSEVWNNVKGTSSLVWFKTKESTRKTVSSISETTNDVFNKGLSEEQKQTLSNTWNATLDKATSFFQSDRNDITYVEPVVENRSAQLGRKAPVITQSHVDTVPVIKIKEIN